MAPERKTPAEPAANKRAVGDKKRVAYLKIRFREVREELQAIKKETAELKKKLGTAPRGAGAKAKAAGGDDDDDED